MAGKLLLCSLTMRKSTERPHRIHSAGISLSELLVCLSVLGAMATVALPTAWTYLPAAAATGAPGRSARS